MDKELFVEQIRREHSGLLRYVIWGILKDQQDREDCLQEVYLRLMEKAPSYNEGRGAIKNWLTAIARNAAVDRLRSQRPQEELDENSAVSDTPEEELIRKERRERLLEAVSSLSDSDRRLVYRKYYYLQSNAKIAAELGVTERTVEGRLYRLRKKLKDMLGGDEFG